MTQRHPYPHADLQGAATRNATAADLLTAFAKSAPALDHLWRRIFDALADISALITEIDRLRAERSTLSYQRANLIAAIRATLAAHDEGEYDPLFYVRDELHAQRRADARRAPGGGR